MYICTVSCVNNNSLTKQHSHVAKNILEHIAEITVRTQKHFVFLNTNYTDQGQRHLEAVLGSREFAEGFVTMQEGLFLVQ